jgi:hypothetical protein
MSHIRRRKKITELLKRPTVADKVRPSQTSNAAAAFKEYRMSSQKAKFVQQFSLVGGTIQQIRPGH